MTSATAEHHTPEPRPWSPAPPSATLMDASHVLPGGPMGMLSVLAHDIRGPLTAMTNTAGLLVEDFEELDRAEIHNMVSTIHRRAVWLQGLVENLLCAATLREGRLRLQAQTAEMPNLVLETLEMVEPLLRQKQQQARLRTSGAVADTLADNRRITQVLTNLVLNASKFSDAGTTIDVTVTQRGPWLRVEVADHGPGLPAGDPDRLFEPFNRGAYDGEASAHLSGAPDGVGLGLAIVKSIVVAHGGCVGANRRRGGGACFWFQLPVLNVVNDAETPVQPGLTHVVPASAPTVPPSVPLVIPPVRAQPEVFARPGSHSR